MPGIIGCQRAECADLYLFDRFPVFNVQSELSGRSRVGVNAAGVFLSEEEGFDTAQCKCPIGVDHFQTVRVVVAACLACMHKLARSFAIALAGIGVASHYNVSAVGVGSTL